MLTTFLTSVFSIPEQVPGDQSRINAYPESAKEKEWGLILLCDERYQDQEQLRASGPDNPKTYKYTSLQLRCAVTFDGGQG